METEGVASRRDRTGEDGSLMACLVSIVGFSGCVLWVQCGAFMPVSPFAAVLGSEGALIARLASLVGLAAGLAAAGAQGRFACLRRASGIGGVGLAVVPFAAWAAGAVRGEAFPACWLVGGVALGWSQSALLACWVGYFGLAEERYTRLSVAFSACSGTLLFAGASNLSSPALGLAAVAAAVPLSAAGALFLAGRAPKARRDGAEAGPALSFFSARSAVSAGVQAAAFGFAATVLLDQGVGAILAGCASGAVGAMPCLLGRASDARAGFAAAPAQRWALPLLVVVLLLLPRGGTFSRLACCCLAVAAWSCCIADGLVRSAAASAELSLQPVGTAALCLLPGQVGFLAGAAACAGLGALSAASGVETASAVLAALAVGAAAWYGFDDATARGRLAGLLARREGEAARRRDEEKRGARFEARYRGLMERHRLSPREREVFALLARGRNAEYISERLVITPSTAKSHIYHIYQKMEIGSQQNLIDAVEEYERGLSDTADEAAAVHAPPS
ncbi:hypothetical protein C1878_06120 [Gordonibacter sp. 28C]|uniref:response regulator transcription factor n=1 Tax=Gordonibacter sp. 28C TaxID=2078569 RepID=UPI000DF7A3E3|nr:helix-turn-helix transcriptional regulator [Gordonibacter sp. 28C]RDB62611.1 hypothetical protein C1878_06120 [Gordonibacter sp. 28C]